MDKNHNIFITGPSSDYELIDSGEMTKLERFGSVRMSRPDPQAIWGRTQPDAWQHVDATFTRKGNSGNWKWETSVNDEWQVKIADISFWVKPTSFKHTGVFPEQSTNWQWMKNVIKNSGRTDVKVLNLFGYTGGATIACLSVGASVVHVDGSKAAIGWAKDNVELNGLSDKPVKYMLDDVKKFVAREVRRGNTYDAIIMDPPVFGYGPHDEPWKIENDFRELVLLLKQVMTPNPLFVLASGYASGYSSVSYINVLTPLFKEGEGVLEHGELTLSSKEGHVLPAGICVRYVFA